MEDFSLVNVEQEDGELYLNRLAVGNHLLVGGDNMGWPRMVEVMCKGAPYFFNVLLDNGLVIRDTLARPGGHYGYRTYSTENFVGSDITNLERKMIDAQDNVKLELDTRMG